VVLAGRAFHLLDRAVGPRRRWGSAEELGHIGATGERRTADNRSHWRSTLASVDQALTLLTQANRTSDSLSHGSGDRVRYLSRPH
jgi:hypothetical protein